MGRAEQPPRQGEGQYIRAAEDGALHSRADEEGRTSHAEHGGGPRRPERTIASPSSPRGEGGDRGPRLQHPGRRPQRRWGGEPRGVEASEERGEDERVEPPAETRAPLPREVPVPAAGSGGGGGSGRAGGRALWPADGPVRRRRRDKQRGQRRRGARGAKGRGVADPKTTLCATSRLCQYSSALKKVRT